MAEGLLSRLHPVREEFEISSNATGVSCVCHIRILTPDVQYFALLVA